MPPDREIPGAPREWVARARGDLALAAAPLPEGAFYEDLCFHAQQAAEKAVKAVYRARGLKFAYIHDIAELLGSLEREGVDIPDDVRESAVLQICVADAISGDHGTHRTRRVPECCESGRGRGTLGRSNCGRRVLLIPAQAPTTRYLTWYAFKMDKSSLPVWP